MRHHFVCKTFIGITAITLLACSNPNSEPTNSNKTAANTTVNIPEAAMNPKAAAALPDAVRQAGVLRIVMDTGAPPVHYIDNDGKTLIGVDADLAAALVQALGLKATISASPFDAIIPGIAAGEFDVAVSQLSPTEERMKVLSFVNYAQAGDGLAVIKGNPKKLSVDNLCGLNVGVVKGSYQDLESLPALSKACTDKGKPAITISTYGDTQAPVLAVTVGRIDAVFIDGPAAEYAAKTTQQVDVIANINMSLVGVASGKDSKLSPALQIALQGLSDSGVYQKILDKWGVTSSTIKDFAINKVE